MKIGDKVSGEVYGKPELIGEIIDYYHPVEEGHYILNDLVTVKWNNGSVAKFYYKHLKVIK